MPAEDQGQTRVSILDAATQAFMETGFSGARVDEIARRAKANKAMIYYHFGSKLGLYRTVLLRLFEGVLDEIDRLKESDLGPEARLRGLYTRVAKHLEGKPALPPIILREILAGGRSMDAEASRTLGRILGFVSETLQEGARIGAFRAVHPLLFHLGMLGPLLLHFAGASFRERVLPREMPGVPQPSNDDMLAHLLEVLGRSLTPATSEPFRTKVVKRKTK
jgi:AcrR family transcriptional regulator